MVWWELADITWFTASSAYIWGWSHGLSLQVSSLGRSAPRFPSSLATCPSSLSHCGPNNLTTAPKCPRCHATCPSSHKLWTRFSTSHPDFKCPSSPASRWPNNPATNLSSSRCLSSHTTMIIQILPKWLQTGKVITGISLNDGITDLTNMNFFQVQHHWSLQWYWVWTC